MMVLENEYQIGDVVYLKTDPDQHARMIISIESFARGELLYKLNCGTVNTAHYAFELAIEKDVLKTVM